MIEYTTLYDDGKNRVVYYPDRNSNKYVFQEVKFDTIGREVWVEITDRREQVRLRDEILKTRKVEDRKIEEEIARGIKKQMEGGF